MLKNVWMIVIAFWGFSYQFNWSLVWKVVCYFVSSFGPMRDRGAKERSQKRERGIVGDTERGNRWKTEKFRFIRHSFHKERHDEKRLHFGPQKRERQREGRHLSKRERASLWAVRETWTIPVLTPFWTIVAFVQPWTSSSASRPYSRGSQFSVC